MSTSSKLKVEAQKIDDCFEEWDRFVADADQGSIFCLSWWIRAVFDGTVEVLTVRRGDNILAGIVLPISYKGLWKVISMPQLTQTLGVLLASNKGKRYEARLSNQMKALRCLVDAIPKVAMFHSNMHYTFKNWLPFYWAGYSQTTRYTYIIEDLSQLDKVFDNIAPKVCWEIRKAERNGLFVEQSDDLDKFLEINGMTFSRQGIARGYSDDFVRRLDEVCTRYGAKTILLTKDNAGRVHSALYLIHDERNMYYLMGGSDPTLRSSGANSLGIWRSIELAHEKGLRYDFEGSMIENVERFFRAFGAIQTPYFEITKYNSIPVRMAAALRDILPLRNRK